MKIERYSSLPVNLSKNADKKETVPVKDKNVNLDVNDISKGTRIFSDKATLVMKASIQEYVEAPADEKRLEAIAAQVKEGTYHISTEDLVDSILDNF